MYSLTSEKDQNKLFWLLNVGGWSVFGLVAYFSGLFWGEQWGLFWYRFAAVVCGIVLSWGLRELYRYFWHWSFLKRALLVLPASYMAAIPMTLVENIVLRDFYGLKQMFEAGEGYLHNILSYFYHFFGWSVLYFALKFYREMEQFKQQEIQAKTLARDAQLKMLRYQLNPHFLFNTLNAISTLILVEETQSANQMVLRLSDFLRYSLVNDPMKQVTLDQEVTSLQLYLGIEKARFEERLQVEFEIEEAANQALIPSLILQPIVENAIKYAIAPSIDGGTISVAARIFAEQLLIEIRDTGPGCSDKDLLKVKADVDEHSCGVGLANCQERLSAIYGKDFSFSYGNTTPQGFQVSLRMPLNKAG